MNAKEGDSKTAKNSRPLVGVKQVTIFCDRSSIGNGQADTRDAAAMPLLGYKGVCGAQWVAYAGDSIPSSCIFRLRSSRLLKLR